ncbi:MAG: hypothetical protein RL687_450, partial [Candidatus Parcubacteria bacterium]
MNFLIRSRQAITLFIDIIIGFLALSITLFIRYGINEFPKQLDSHLAIFSIIILIFIFSFYIFNLYSPRFNKNITEFNDSFIKSVIVSFSLSILFFYALGSFFNLAPKTNLIIFTLFFSLIDFYVRIMVKRQYASKNINRKVLIVNNNQNPLVNEIRNNNHSGYEVVCEIDNFNYEKILDLKPDTVIIGSIESENLPHIYALTKSDIYTSTISLFYEQAFQKIPTEVSTEESIVEYTNKANNIFTTLKRFIDITISILFLIVLSPIIVVVSILVKVSSRGPVLFCQTRVGLNDNLFTIYKFRSMYIDSEKDGPVWTKDDKTDSRITPLGRVLRKTHLDEIPQLINIFRGDISFVGPRPE